MNENILFIGLTTFIKINFFPFTNSIFDFLLFSSPPMASQLEPLNGLLITVL